MSYQFVEQLHKKAVTVERLCRVLGVSRSGYYGARQRAKLAPKVCLVSTQLKAEFVASGTDMLRLESDDGAELIVYAIEVRAIVMAATNIQLINGDAHAQD